MALDYNDCSTTHSFIKDHWVDSITKDDGTNERSLGMPAPYVTPCVKGGHFTAMYYWDTFFTVVGAHLDGQKQLVGHCAENFAHVIENQGYIPNASVKGMLRSQPPVASHVYRLAYELLGDKIFLRRAMNATIAEHAFWMSQRVGIDGLNHYGHFCTPNGVDNFYWTLRKRCPQLPEPLMERRQFMAHKLAEAESGWDFSPRFRDRCMDIYAVDLNALLFAAETNIAHFMRELDDLNAEKWQARADERQALMQKLLWNEETGFFHDYDAAKREQTPHLSAASYFAMWCGVPSESQAERMRSVLPQLEGEHGLHSMVPGTGERVPGVNYQWDHPNAWAPLQFGAIAGCQRYGFDADAKRLAEKWVRTCNVNFKATDNLWEKYNADTGGIDVVNEYDMPPFMGWTAGVYVYSLKVLGLI